MAIDMTMLALVMVDAINFNASLAAASITRLQLSNPPATWIVPLKHCAEAYKKTLTLWVPQAIEALNKGKPKVAENAVFGSGGSSTECAIGFSGSKSPLTAVNTGVGELSADAKTIIHLLE